tara:strand:+ start:116 stop:739 length:624 start_codon:yes stop_codon:yes gene_type:complete
LKKLVIIGAGGHCRSVLSTAKSMKLWQDFKIIDLNYTNKKEKIIGYKVYPIEKVQDYLKRKLDFFIAIGDNKVRKSTYRYMNKNKCSFVNIIHPNSHVDKNSIIGKGNFVGQFSNIGACAKLGNFNIINNYGNVEHEVTMGDFNHLAPSSTVCGRSQLKDNIFIGSNAVIIEKLSIAKNTTIGAGSVVLKSVDQPNQKLVGVPARII